MARLRCYTLGPVSAKEATIVDIAEARFIGKAAYGAESAIRGRTIGRRMPRLLSEYLSHP
jgi:hypothetical protein